MREVQKVQDVTERKLAELEMTRVAKELQTFIDTANAPIFGIERLLVMMIVFVTVIAVVVFITQSKLLGGSTPQTPRWGRGAAPKPPAH